MLRLDQLLALANAAEPYQPPDGRSLDVVLALPAGQFRNDLYGNADRFAAHSIPEPSAMTTALKKLSADNLSNLTPHPFFVFLHYSHPPLLQRMDAIAKAMDTK